MNNYIIFLILIILFFLYNIYNKSNVNYINNNNVNNKTYIDDTNLNSDFLNPSNKIHFYLLNLSKEISNKNKINLSGSTIDNLYIKTTIDDNMLQYVKYLIQSILKKTLKLKYNIDYYFKDIIEVYQQYDKYKNQRYIIKCFIYEIENFYQVKILLDLVVINNKIYLNYIGEDLSSNINILNKYDINIEDQGVLLNKNNIKNNIKAIVDSYYKKYYNIIGYNNSELEYDHYVSKLDTVKKYDIGDLSKYYLPPNINSIYSNNIGNNNSYNWDEYGVNYSINNYPINTESTLEQPNIPNIYPGSEPTTRNYTGIYSFINDINQNGGNVATSTWY